MLNCIVIQGRLKADPEIRHTQNNTAVASITLAVQRNRKDMNGDYPVDWIDCVLWGKTAEHAAQWFHKGDQAIVKGRLESRDWQDKQGNNRRSWEVQAESIDFCGGKSQQLQQPTGRPVHINGEDFTELLGDDGDVPF
jgi:single-strand DNA-binding protein